MVAKTFGLKFPEQMDSVPSAERVLRYRDQFYQDPEFEFEVLICRGWRPADSESATIRRFLHTDTQATLEIRATHQQWEIAPGDALQQDLLQRQHRIDNRRDSFTRMGTVSDLLTVDDNNATVHRSTCVKHGNRLLTASCSVAYDKYEDVADDFFLFVDSLRFQRAELEISAEQLRHISVTDGAFPFEFSVPESWTVRPRIVGSIYDVVSDDRSGHIRVFVGAGRTGEDTTEHLRQLLTSTKQSCTAEFDLQVGPAGILSAAAKPGFEAACAVTYPLYRPNQLDADELSIVCQSASEKSLCLGLTSASARRAPLVWARNKRALEILNETFCFPNR